MAKNITTFVKSIGANKVATEMKNRTQCYWDWVPRNTFHDDRSCVNYHHQVWFCVPAGICCVRFEIWGAGGAAHGGCNCMYSPPSGSGAYARKTIAATPGECYRVNVGWHWCCTSPSGGDNTTHSSYCTNNQRHSWITGTGLTNFCAEHGCSNRTCCCNTAVWATNCAKYQNDSDNAGARFFGADEGVRGKIGFLELMDSAATPTDYYHYRPWVPFPGGLWNKYGGHVVAGHFHQGNLNRCCNAEHSQGQMGRFFGHTSNNTIGEGRWAGWGTIGGVHCGGSSGCASYQNAGRARITYSCANTFED